MPRRHTRSFRCMRRLVRGSERKGGPGRKCGARVTVEPHKLGRCLKCGCDYMWADVTPQVDRVRQRQLCNDSRCVYGHPHSHYSRDCVNNPFRDTFGLADEPGRRETGEDPSW